MDYIYIEGRRVYANNDIMMSNDDGDRSMMIMERIDDGDGDGDGNSYPLFSPISRYRTEYPLFSPIS